MNITTSLNVAPVVTLGHLLKRQFYLKLDHRRKGTWFAHNLPKVFAISSGAVFVFSQLLKMWSQAGMSSVGAAAPNR